MEFACAACGAVKACDVDETDLPPGWIGVMADCGAHGVGCSPACARSVFESIVSHTEQHARTSTPKLRLVKPS